MKAILCVSIRPKRYFDVYFFKMTELPDHWPSEGNMYNLSVNGKYYNDMEVSSACWSENYSNEPHMFISFKTIDGDGEVIDIELVINDFESDPNWAKKWV